jgi:pimeloyl-ACP methyl ester carboxylesterase
MDVVVEIIKTLGLERTTIIGHSMGGVICIGAALRLPDVVHKMVLVDAAGLTRYVPWSYRLASLPGLGTLMIDIMSRVSSKTSRNITRRLFYNENILPAEVLEWLNNNRQVSWTRQDLLRILRISVNLKGFSDEIYNINRPHLLEIPILLIYGTKDRVFPLKYFKDAAKSLPNARTLVFEECGHLPQIEKAAEFNEGVIAFLKE